MKPNPDIPQNTPKREGEKNNRGEPMEVRAEWDMLLNSLAGRYWTVSRAVQSHLISQGRIPVLVEGETTLLLKRIFIL